MKRFTMFVLVILLISTCISTPSLADDVVVLEEPLLADSSAPSDMEITPTEETVIEIAPDAGTESVLSETIPETTPQAEVSVGTQAELQAAIDKSNGVTTIKLTANIEVTNTKPTGLDSGIVIGENKKIILDGSGTYSLIRHRSFRYGDVVTVVTNASLTLQNITIDGNKDNVTCRGCLLGTEYDGRLTINAGTVVKNNHSILGTGSGVEGNGHVVINGGEIKGNVGTNGVGVRVDQPGGTFLMTGGTISGNTADLGGGGLAVKAFTTATMTGGTITGNTANSGGGVAAGGKFIMTGGKISGNFIQDGADFHGNLIKGVGTDLYLNTDRPCTISGSAVIGSGDKGIYNYQYEKVNHSDIFISGSLTGSMVIEKIALDYDETAYPQKNFAILSGDNYTITQNDLNKVTYIDGSGQNLQLKLKNGQVVLSDGTPDEPDLPVPTGVKVAVNSYNSLKISWDKAADVDGYYIYRAKSGGKYATLKKLSGAEATSYIDTGLPTGDVYYYRVITYKMVDGITYKSASAKAVGKTVQVSQPGSFKATGYAGGKIRLTWTKPAGASGYILSRATSADGKFINIKTIGAASTSYTDTGLTVGKTYYYKLTPYRMVAEVKKHGIAADPINAKAK